MALPSDHSPNGAPTATARPRGANGDLVSRVQQLRLDDQLGAAPRAGGGGSWLPWVLCGLLAVTWAGVGARWYRSARTGTGTAAPREPAGAAPSGQPSDRPAAPTGAVAGAGELVFQLKGNLIPSLQIAVSPIDVAGEVTEVNFKEGDRVKKGFVLARLRDTRYRNEYETAEANVRAAKARLDGLLPESVREDEKLQAQAELDEAKATLQRAEQDMERVNMQRATVSIPAQEVDKAVSDVRAGRARVLKAAKTLALLVQGPRKEQIAAAEAELTAAKHRRDEAKRMLDNCEIRSPIDGTVLTKKSDVGSLVSPTSFNVASALCEVADLSKMEVELDVPEREITKVRPNLECKLAADADPNRAYRGRVDRVMPIADDSKNVIKVRVQVDLRPGEEPGAFLKPKMSVTVTGYNREYLGK